MPIDLTQLGPVGIGAAIVLGIILGLWKYLFSPLLERAEKRSDAAIANTSKLADDVAALTDAIRVLSTELREERLASLGRTRASLERGRS